MDDSPEDGAEKEEICRTVLQDGLTGRERQHSALEIEGGLLRKFKRQCHHYAQHTPKKDDRLEWLALMRHYGAPTRLLDCTYSFFVAVCFALEEAEERCAVWAINSHWISERVKCIAPETWKALEQDPNIREPDTKELFWQAKRIVYAVNPYWLNERLIIQQGVFLCPGDVSIPFEDNLAELLSEDDSRDNFIKFVVRVGSIQKNEILRHLLHMNMSRATLFPGLGGFAESLKTWLVFPDVLKPDEDWIQGLADSG